MKVLSIIGARPQFVKAAPVSRALAAAGIDEVRVHTGQHYDANMSDVFFEELAIPAPHYHLGIGGGTHGEMTGRMLAALEAVTVQERPDWMLVYGDTNSTLAGALVAAKAAISLAHVEAGLRSFNRAMPEEVNRILTDRVSDLLLVPTETARRNLLSEGVDASRIHVVGDVMYDTALACASRVETSDAVARSGLEPGAYVLATIHRQENTDDRDRLRAIFDGLDAVGADYPVVLPLHPRTRGALDRYGIKLGDGIRIVEPVGYLNMTALERAACVIVTDSGGVQKEAYFHRVPCVTLRDETEWVELVDAGWNRICPPLSAARICEAVRSAIDEGTPPEYPELYGDGHAAEAIAQALLDAEVRSA